MDILCAIDGTGPWSDATYAKDFADSHVNQMAKGWHSALKFYNRGPSLEGAATDNLAQACVDYARAGWKIMGEMADSVPQSFSKPRVFLAGYSRGGAAVIEAAKRLSKLDIPVHAMFLFDAVDRSVAVSNVDEIPANVAFCFHALRNPRAGSREIFGNCGRKPAAGVAYNEQFFLGTHGAMGGLPGTEVGDDGKIVEGSDTVSKGLGALSYLNPGATLAKKLHDIHHKTRVTIAEDQAASKAVWAWMSTGLKQARSQDPSVQGKLPTLGYVSNTR